MTWTYDPATMATNARDQIRFELGDTDTDDQLLQDEEIDYAYAAQSSDLWGTVARCARAISFKLARQAKSITSGPLQVSLIDRARQYADLAKAAEAKVARKGLPLVVTVEDGVRQTFHQGMHDHGWGQPGHTGEELRSDLYGYTG